MIKSAGPGNDKEKMRAAEQGEKGAVHAVTQYTVLANAGQQAAWVALKPETGRTHQLRFHMAEIGCAILGDRKYTGKREAPSGLADGLHLHARALRLPGLRGRDIRDRRRAAAPYQADLRPYLASMNVRFRTLRAQALEAGPLSAQLLTQAHDLLAAGQAEELARCSPQR